MLLKTGGAVYILTNKIHSVLYIGVTSDLRQRIRRHREKQYPNNFTARYNCDKLVYYELFEEIADAITREKALKGGNRQRKIDLIEKRNRGWLDLWETEIQHW